MKKLNKSAVGGLIGGAFVLLFVMNLYAGDLRVLEEKTFSTRDGRNLNLSTSSGDVYISTWDKPEVYVKISGNREAQNKMKFRFESNDEGVRIISKRDSWLGMSFFWSNIYMKYEVKVPANYNAYVSTAGGDIKVYNLSGAIKFETSGGDIALFNTKGKTKLSTSGGDIKLENTSGDITLSTSGGDIGVKNFSGNLDASTSGGDIDLDGKSGVVKASTSGGDIHLNYFDVNNGIYLESTGGDIVVRVPSNFSAYADLSTTGGEIVCDLPITHRGKMTSSKLKGDLNGGGKPLNCSTTGGDIKVTR